MRFSGAWILFFALVTGCRSVPQAPSEVVTEDTDDSELTLVPMLRKYCRACHAIGDAKFLISGSDEEVLEHLFSAAAPVAQKVWADAIVDVLNWPDGQPPAPDALIGPARQYMPVGAMRSRLHLSTRGPVSSRQYLSDELKRLKEERSEVLNQSPVPPEEPLP